MALTHILLTRPQPESQELAGLLSPLGLQTIVQPAFTYCAVDAREEQAADYEQAARATRGMLVFTSPRSVQHSIAQLPPETLGRLTVAAIGPATAKALNRAGIRVDIVPRGGFTSEDLLEMLAASLPDFTAGESRAWIVAAPGGRKKLRAGLEQLGWICSELFVYRAQAAAIDRHVLAALKSADGILSVWTSANSMKALSQRLPPATWFPLCQGEWLVISERLRRLARAYGPSRIHLAGGPDNSAIVTAVRSIVNETRLKG